MAELFYLAGAGGGAACSSSRSRTRTWRTDNHNNIQTTKNQQSTTATHVGVVLPLQPALPHCLARSDPQKTTPQSRGFQQSCELVQRVAPSSEPPDAALHQCLLSADPARKCDSPSSNRCCWRASVVSHRKPKRLLVKTPPSCRRRSWKRSPQLVLRLT